MSRLPTASLGEIKLRTISNQSNDEQFESFEDDELHLSEYIKILRDKKWLIAVVISATLLASFVYVTFTTPVYRANLLLQIEDSAPESKSFLTDTTGLGELKTTANGEIQVLGSRLILGAAVDQAGLQIRVQPRYIPIFGSWLSRHSKTLSEPGIFGIGSYVSGTERLIVKKFEVPAELEDSEPFILTATGNDQYTVTHESLSAQIKGTVGAVVRTELPNGVIEIQIEQLEANPKTEFKISISSKLQAIENLQERLIMSEQGRQSNVINVALEDTDRARLSRTLNAIGNQYLRQNMDRKSAEAEKTLAFLNSQLPVFERQLKISEDAYARFRNANGTVAFDEEAKIWLKSTADLQTNLIELQQNRLELLRTNNNNHPKVQTLNEQISAIQSQLAALNRKIAAMPNMQRDALRLERDVRANSAQYQSMQNNALQMRLVSEGKIGNVRLLDSAVPSKQPVKPQKSLIIALAGFLGALLGVSLSLISARTQKGLIHHKEIVARTGLDLYGVIPHSTEKTLLQKKESNNGKQKTLADILPNSETIEALRGIRSALKTTIENATNNLILITGPTSGVGKSFVAMNLSMVFAQTGKRVLLIDADFRDSNKNGIFNLGSTVGLSNLIVDKFSLTDAIKFNVRKNLDVLTSGPLPAIPSDMFESIRLPSLMQQLSENYDHVIIDCAPVLTASDTLTIAPMCGCVLLVARAQVSEIHDVQETLRRIIQAGGSVDGLVFNGIDRS